MSPISGLRQLRSSKVMSARLGLWTSLLSSHQAGMETSLQMALNVRSTDLYQSLDSDWQRRVQSRQWRRDITQLIGATDQLRRSQLDTLAITDLVDQLGGSNGSRYLSQTSRRSIGCIVDMAASNTTAMRISLQAILVSVDGYWWPLKFRSFETESALSEVMMFAFIELSDQSKVGPHRRDPLACVRMNATNRALSSLRTQQRRTRQVDPFPTTALECRNDAEKLVDEIQESLQFLTLDISSESGSSKLCAASFVLHRGFGLSFQDLARSSDQSKATHHRRSRQVEQALRNKYCQV